MTRDEEIALNISQSERTVLGYVWKLDELVAQAHTEGAHAHAGLYAAVAESLREARYALDKAHKIMDSDDPEDYA